MRRCSAVFTGPGVAKLLLPDVLFKRIAGLVPPEFHQNLLLVGSIAAAYHFRTELAHQGVNTKDADIVIRPAGAVAESRTIAEALLAAGWRRHEKCFALPTPENVDEFRAICLLPPVGDDFFLEFLTVPSARQTTVKAWMPVQLSDGWYGLPSFRFMGLANVGSLTSGVGIRYANPAMMALANLLSHPTLGTERMSEPIGGKKLLRSAKDLGRVLALAWLAGADETDRWAEMWWTALQQTFPAEAATLARTAGRGLRELLDDPDALEQARHAVDVGLLAGRNVTVENLRALGDRLTFDAIDVLAARVAGEP